MLVCTFAACVLKSYYASSETT